MDLDNKIIKMPNLDYVPDSRGIGYTFYDCMLKHKQKVAQIYGPTGEKDTYADLLQRSIRTAIVLKQMGIKPGDYISLCTFNHLDSGTPIIASFFIGAIIASLDPRLSLEETVRLLQQIPPKIIFVSYDGLELIEKALERVFVNIKIVVFGDTKTNIPFCNFLQPSAKEVGFRPYEVKSLKDRAIVFFSSGTSGMLKGICHDHYSTMCQHVNYIKCGFNLDINFSYASPFWAIYFSNLGSNIMTGTTRLIYPTFDPSDIWKIFDHKITSLFLTPFQILTMHDQGRPNDLDISSLENIRVGGAPLSHQQMIKIRETFPEVKIHMIYGLSEIPGPVVSFKLDDLEQVEFLKKKPLSVGTGMLGMSYKIVDPETEEVLGPSQKGELRVKTKFQLSGYHKIDSSGIWDRDGWLKTGDIAYYDEDSCFYILDRLKEIIKYRCMYIVPATLESVLLTHPAISAAVVIGIPHELDGEHPMAIVVLNSSRSAVGQEEIEKYVEERVCDQEKLRAGVKIVANLPLTPSGKINRKLIRQLVLDGNMGKDGLL